MFVIITIIFKTSLLRCRSIHRILSILLSDKVSVFSSFLLISLDIVQHLLHARDSILHSNSNGFLNILFIFWNPSLSNPMSVRISVPHFLSIVKTLPIYLKLRTWLKLKYPFHSFHVDNHSFCFLGVDLFSPFLLLPDLGGPTGFRSVSSVKTVSFHPSLTPLSISVSLYSFHFLSWCYQFAPSISSGFF